MDHADEDYDGDIFIYRGGLAPQHITHARIDKSVGDIGEGAFWNCKHLVQVDTHDGLRKVGKNAFRLCESLRRIDIKSVVEIDEYAFYECRNLTVVEFGDRLETIGSSAFCACVYLKHLKLPSVVTIGDYAFNDCIRLTDIVLSKQLETMGTAAFRYCESLDRIAIPLKRDLLEYSDTFQVYSQFGDCWQLNRVDLVGGIHKTVLSLHMESWRTEMIAEINRINQVLPNTRVDDKTGEIRQWMHSVIDKMDRYKSEHYRYVKEGITLLELALWKAKLCKKEDIYGEGMTKKVKLDAKSARKERRITCGADLVIKNVLPFLKLE